MSNYGLTHLKTLESESMYVIREAYAQTERQVLLFSGGKDSILLTLLARKAFYPGKIPFPIMHIDTGHNFSETLEYRDWFVKQLDLTLIVRYVQDSINAGRVTEEPGPNTSRNWLQSVTLMDAVSEFTFDAVLGGGRRDEEKARAKERFFSFRDRFGQWDPKNQRPELWMLFNARKRPGEHFRVFPLSNWTELDVWQYLGDERMPLPSLYFAHEREFVRRDGMLLARSPYIELRDGEIWERSIIRFRTIGDMTCTGALESHAKTVGEVITEIAAIRVTERGGRADDRRSDTAMEDRKRQGYF
ncbi:MAG: sulfate adenylyltransferase subunit CysD [Spirochaetia bacterium]